MVVGPTQGMWDGHCCPRGQCDSHCYTHGLCARHPLVHPMHVLRLVLRRPGWGPHRRLWHRVLLAREAGWLRSRSVSLRRCAAGVGAWSRCPVSSYRHGARVCSRARLPNCTGKAWGARLPGARGWGQGGPAAFSALSLLNASGLSVVRVLGSQVILKMRISVWGRGLAAANIPPY